MWKTLKNTQTNSVYRGNVENSEGLKRFRFLWDRDPSKFKAPEFAPQQSEDSVLPVPRFKIPRPHNTGGGKLSGGPRKSEASELCTTEFRDSVLNGERVSRVSEFFTTHFTNSVLNVRCLKIPKPRNPWDVMLSGKPRHFELRMHRIHLAPLDDFSTELPYFIDMLWLI